jgi:excisionase family DNA binding protein
MRPAANQPRDQPQASQRLTVQEAAEVLGVTVDSVRGRIKRGTLTSIKGEAGTVYVLLEERVSSDQSPGEFQLANDQPHDQSQLVDRMASEIEFLRGELQRKDAILLSMTEGLKALEAPSQPRESPVSSSEDADNGTPPPEQQEPSQRRSWWREFFGLE